MANKPRVLIDARSVKPVPHGFGSYISRMAQGLAMTARSQGRTLAYEPVFIVSPETPVRELAGYETIMAASPFLALGELLEIPGILQRSGASLYHSPTFSSLLAAPCPWIVTVHDLNHLTYGGLSKRIYYRRVLRPFARRARALLTVSEFSRQELARWTGVSSEHIEVVYNAIDLVPPPSADELQAILARHGLERGRYFFCLSNPKPHKNVGLLVEAYRAYRERASIGATQTQAAMAAWPLVTNVPGFESVPGVRFISEPRENEARALMGAAGAVVFPSLYEGFGLPPVEAVSVGAPVIVSRIAPHEEGLAGLPPGEVRWADPQDRGSWTAALEAAARGELKAPSFASRQWVLDRFSVEKLGRHMDRIYRGVLSL